MIYGSRHRRAANDSGRQKRTSACDVRSVASDSVYGPHCARRSTYAVGISAIVGTAWLVAIGAFGSVISPAAAAEPIRIGMPIGLSGANSVVAPSVVQAAKLAIAEINEHGGILGRQVELIVADDGSGADGAVKAFNSLVFQQKANVIITMETSAARNAGLPVVARGKTPFIYTSSYEGRSCSPYLFVDAWVPDQQVAPVVDYFMKEKKAKTFFLVGSDYAFGRGMLGFTRDYIKAHGGTVIGEEYLPMDATDWTPVLSKLRSANPDALLSSTAGGAPNVTLTKQLRASGIDVLFGNLGVDEGTAKAIGSDAAGIYISQSYLTSLDNPQNKAFIQGLQKMFGTDMNTPNDLSEPEYDGVYLYKAAVEKAGSLDTQAILRALPTVSFQGARGPIQMSKDHHAPLTMYLGQVQQDGSVRVIQSFPNVDPGNQCPNLR
ncbi:MAG: substrate-binding protein [Acetobacteraceae bacterium]|nr:substrate-binding protein [Acetobacteraceae bacterium]